MKLEIVTPEKMIFSKEVAMVVLPGSEGDFGVLTNHSPLVSDLREGEIAVYNTADGQPTEKFTITGGVVQVTPTDCTVLATSVQAA
jgi:F-type H+-transporting ATPase subunit epsilon